MVKKLIQLELKRSRLFVSENKNTAKSILFSLVATFFVILFGILMYYVAVAIRRLTLGNEYVTSAIFLTITTLSISNIFSYIKKVMLSTDNDLFVKMPIRKGELLASKMIFIYVQSLLISFTILFSTVGLYGIAAQKSPVYFINLSILILTLPIITMLIANVFSVPLLKVALWLKRHFLWTILFALISLAVIFALYSRMIEFIIFLVANTTGNYFNPDLLTKLRDAISSLHFCTWLSMFLSGDDYQYIVLVAEAIMIFYLFLRRYFAHKYFALLALSIEMPSEIIKRKTKTRPFFYSYILREIKCFVRRPQYSLPLFLLPLIMPVIVTQTIRVVSGSAVNMIGDLIYFPSMLLAFLFFATLINSYSATVLSKDGSACYINNIIPHRFVRQMYIKGLVCLILILAPTILTLTLMCKEIPTLMYWYLMLFILLFNIGNILQGMAIDIKSSRSTRQDAGRKEDKNTMRAISMGLLVLLTIVLQNLFVSYFVDAIKADTISLIIVSIYALSQIIFFRFTVRRRAV